MELKNKRQKFFKRCQNFGPWKQDPLRGGGRDAPYHRLTIMYHKDRLLENNKTVTIIILVVTVIIEYHVKHNSLV